MLSSMTEKMRETADKVERFGHRNRDWLWRDATTITRAVVELRDAADVIDELRCTCNDIQRDNDGLRQLVHDIWHAARHSIDCEECDYYDSCSGYPCMFHERMRELRCSDGRR